MGTTTLVDCADIGKRTGRNKKDARKKLTRREADTFRTRKRSVRTVRTTRKYRLTE